MIAATVLATKKAILPVPPPEHVPTFIEVRTPVEPVPAAPRASAPAATPSRSILPPIELAAPISVPTTLPSVKLTDRLVTGDDFNIRPRGDNTNSGELRSSATDHTGDRYPSEVHKVARMAPNNPEPDYPNILRSTGQVGNVVVSFVIDTTGRADMHTYKVESASHPLFEEAVKKVLPRYQFIPAEIDGRLVRMVVRLPFEFRMAGGGG
jgi:TonB family protein